MTVSAYILRRNHWGEESCKWVLAGIEAAGLKGVKVINKDETAIPSEEWCIRWATTSTVPGNPKVINKTSASAKTVQKGQFRKTLAEAGLAPKTVINEMPSDDMYPVIIRPLEHSKSEDLYIASTEKEVKDAVADLRKETNQHGFYCSEFIDKEKEYRVFIVSGRVVAVADKTPDDPTDASWGCVGNGLFYYVKWRHWPIEAVRKSCLAMKISGLDFGAVDVILKDQEAYVLEINTGPHLTEYYGYQMGVGIAHILETGSRDFIEPGSKVNNPYSYVHPAISNSAILD